MNKYKAFTDEEQADVMDRAADLLLFEGRARGTALNENGEYCLRGAMRQAEAGDVVNGASWLGWLSPAVQSFRLWLTGQKDTLPAVYVGGDGLAIDFAFNDHIKDDFVVIDALRACAKELRDS